ncbi:unnamed protein product [Echinostoma caproni]|uniref:Uncharacterized protein n=1 Tax=Echinostoma caproni TaxID=27848 RepID=A0A183AJV8_9TREM|nr:unnamed protein product [Echinostoma caproni]
MMKLHHTASTLSQSSKFSQESSQYDRPLSEQIPPIESPFRPPPFTKPLFMDHLDLTYHKAIRLNCHDLDTLRVNEWSHGTGEDQDEEEEEEQSSSEEAYTNTTSEQQMHRFPRLQLNDRTVDESSSNSVSFDLDTEGLPGAGTIPSNSSQSWSNKHPKALSRTTIEELYAQCKPQPTVNGLQQQPQKQQQNSYSTDKRNGYFQIENMKSSTPTSLQHKVAPKIWRLMQRFTEPPPNELKEQSEKQLDLLGADLNSSEFNPPIIRV